MSCPWLFAYTPAPRPWGPFKGQGGAMSPTCSHLFATNVRGCSFRPAVKVALGYGYIPTGIGVRLLTASQRQEKS